jgi:hypothetical protein
MTEQGPDKYVSWLGAIKGLSLGNVLVIALLAIIAVPVYVIYRALDDKDLLDRFLSTYSELSSQNVPCALRHVQARGGPQLWGISSGFAFQGADRWFVNVVLDHEPTREELVSYCESLKLIADRMLGRGDQVHSGPVPGVTTDGGRHDRIVPEDQAQ